MSSRGSGARAMLVKETDGIRAWRRQIAVSSAREGGALAQRDQPLPLAAVCNDISWLVA